MTDIRANCPSCGQVDMKAEAISLELGEDGERGRYGFICPDCSVDVSQSADRRTIDLLLAIGDARAKRRMRLDRSRLRTRTHARRRPRSRWTT